MKAGLQQSPALGLLGSTRFPAMAWTWSDLEGSIHLLSIAFGEMVFIFFTSISVMFGYVFAIIPVVQHKAVAEVSK